MQGVTTLYERWKDLLETGKTNTDEFKWVANELKNGIKSIEWDINDLDETITIVENNKQKFKMDPVEMQSRKAFVAEIKKKINVVKAEFVSPRAKGLVENQQRTTLMSTNRPPTDRYSRLEQAIEEDNENFVDNEVNRQSQIFAVQDDDLDKLSHTVGNLKIIGNTINDQIDTHTHLISDIDNQANKADSGLKGAVKRVSDLIDRQKDTTQWCVIIVLILVLVGLIVLVIYL